MTSVHFDCYGSNHTITGNRIDGTGITLAGSSNTISGNHLTRSCIHVNGDSNTIASNNVTDGVVGIRLNSGSNNVVFENNVTGNWNTAIHLYTASNNLIYDNYLANNIDYNYGKNGYGISLSGTRYHAENNTFYRNTLVNNSRNIRIEEPFYSNCWNNDFEGNYWDNYNGSDADGDGIGDTLYIIDENNQDRHPLMAPNKIFDAGTWEGTPFSVGVISNSTVSDFSFNPESARIRFNVEGETGTAGFCRIAIPKDLLSAENNFIVLLDSNIVNPTVNEDTTNTYLNFSYTHSTITVMIIGTTAIPEFPSWVILPLFLAATLAAAVYTKKLDKNRFPQSY